MEISEILFEDDTRVRLHRWFVRAWLKRPRFGRALIPARLFLGPMDLELAPNQHPAREDEMNEAPKRDRKVTINLSEDEWALLGDEADRLNVPLALRARQILVKALEIMEAKRAYQTKLEYFLEHEVDSVPAEELH